MLRRLRCALPRMYQIKGELDVSIQPQFFVDLEVFAGDVDMRRRLPSPLRLNWHPNYQLG